MAAKKYVEISTHQDLEELLATGLPFEKYQWAVNPADPCQGRIQFYYIPQWISHATNLYHDSSFGGMTLTEFLEKMNPDR